MKVNNFFKYSTLATILHINTAFETATVFLSLNGEIIALKESFDQKAHASFVEPAIKEVCGQSGVALKEIDAVCVVNGPGSYTGLRVGLASAKALCYALNKPLILLNTLDVMAHALKTQSKVDDPAALFCPMIDARRSEVFTALYDNNLNIIETYNAAIVDENFWSSYIEKIIILGGNGSFKAQQFLNSENFTYINPLKLNTSILHLCAGAFNRQTLSNIAYSEPFYLKPVYFKN